MAKLICDRVLGTVMVEGTPYSPEPETTIYTVPDPAHCAILLQSSAWSAVPDVIWKEAPAEAPAEALAEAKPSEPTPAPRAPVRRERTAAAEPARPTAAEPARPATTGPEAPEGKSE
jgi:hypothetical protein